MAPFHSDNKPKKPTKLKRAPSAKVQVQSSLQSKTPPEANVEFQLEENLASKQSSDVCQTLTRSSNRNFQNIYTPTVYQPILLDSHPSVFLYQFTSAFFHSKAAPTRPNVWVQNLPALLQSAPSSALVCAIRAVTMAHWGRKNRDKTMQIEACHWYDKGLETQRLESHQMETQLANGGDVADQVSDATICAPIMFSLFESLMTTSAAAWAQHIAAAGRMLELRGPEKCQDGIMHHVFRSVRVGFIHLGMSFQRTTVFASEEWCRVPFEHQGKAPMDKLIDIQLQLPDLLLLRDRMRMMRKHNHELYEVTRQVLQDKAQDIISRLTQYWGDMADTVGLGHDYSRFIEVSGFKTEPAEWIIEDARPAYPGDTFAAVNVAMYDAASVVAHSMAWETATGDAEIHKRRVVLHCASILAMVAIHERQGFKSGGTIAMIFPMKVVCRASPSDHQRRSAESMFSNWAQARGLDGLKDFMAVPEKFAVFNGQSMTNESEVDLVRPGPDPGCSFESIPSTIGANRIPPPQLWIGALLYDNRKPLPPSPNISIRAK